MHCFKHKNIANGVVVQWRRMVVCQATHQVSIPLEAQIRDWEKGQVWVDFYIRVTLSLSSQLILRKVLDSNLCGAGAWILLQNRHWIPWKTEPTIMHMRQHNHRFNAKNSLIQTHSGQIPCQKQSPLQRSVLLQAFLRYISKQLWDARPALYIKTALRCQGWQADFRALE